MEHVQSIVELGVLSHKKASAIAVRSVADAKVQQLRRAKRIRFTNGHEEPLHEFAIAYLNPRNAMLFRVKGDDVAVVKFRAQEAFLLPGAYVSDRNASTQGAVVGPSPRGLADLNYSEVMATQWVFSGRRNEMRMQAMQAELLVPDEIPASLIAGVHVRTEADRARLLRSDLSVPVVVDPYTFFS